MTRGWNKRFFTVENDALTWRQNEKSPDVPRSIPLTEITQAYKLKTRDKSFRARIIVRSTRKTLCLKASSDKDCERWVKALQMQLDLRDGGTAAGPEGVKNRRKLSSSGSDIYENLMKFADKSLSDLSQIKKRHEREERERAAASPSTSKRTDDTKKLPSPGQHSEKHGRSRSPVLETEGTDRFESLSHDDSRSETDFLSPTPTTNLHGDRRESRDGDTRSIPRSGVVVNDSSPKRQRQCAAFRESIISRVTTNEEGLENDSNALSFFDDGFRKRIKRYEEVTESPVVTIVGDLEVYDFE